MKHKTSRISVGKPAGHTGILKIYQNAFSIHHPAKNSYMDLTPVLRKELERSRIKMGLLNVYVKHTTTGLWINESGEGIPHDLEATLERFSPKSLAYAHDDKKNRSTGIPDDEPLNAYSHQRSLLFSPSYVIPVHAGAMTLGTYQSVLFVELDGPRERRDFALTIMGH